MGGIAGIFHTQTGKPVDPERIRAMTDALAHRGAGGGGLWTARGIGLGDRHAAADDHPLVDRTGELAIVVDGVLQDTRRLKAELEGHGHGFERGGDAELILAGWRQWGPACLQRLDGTFAFALHDARRQSLFLARDRLGVKPLHHVSLSDGSIAFASELRALLVHPLLRRAADIGAVDDYMTLGYVPDDACLISGVNKLAAGHYLLVERGRARTAPVAWWSLDFSTRGEGATGVLRDGLTERVGSAVRRAMVARPVAGALLSGGIDSASVIALMAEASARAVDTVSVDPGGQGGDADAAQIAARFATRHRTAPCTPVAEEPLDGFMPPFDEPFGDPALIAIAGASRLARERMAVALVGGGADLMLAGARRLRRHAFAENARAILPDRMRDLAGRIGTAWPRASALAALTTDGNVAYAIAAAGDVGAQRAGLYTEDMLGALDQHAAPGAASRCLEMMRAAPARDPLDRAQYAEMRMTLPGNYLAALDRIGAASGVDLRAPLLDHHVVTFATQLPVRMRVRHGTGKWLLRKAMSRHLPRDLVDRQIDGCNVPVSDWLRGPLAGHAAALAGGRSALMETGWFRAASLRELAERHRDGMADHGLMLWRLLMLDRSLHRLFGIGV